MIQPTNEAEVIELFNLAQDRLGWRIVESWSNRFPDAIIENANGQRLSAEFEHCAKNFQAHGHDPAGCDLIICWRNGWPDAPLPVWALSECIPADSNAAVALGVSRALGVLRELRRQPSLVVEAQDVSELYRTLATLKRELEMSRKAETGLPLLLENAARTIASATQILEQAQEAVALTERVQILERELRRAQSGLEEEKRKPQITGRIQLARIEACYLSERDGFLLWEFMGDLMEDPGASAIFDDWELQRELANLAVISGAHTGVDVTHPLWTGKPRERTKLRKGWGWAYGERLNWWIRIPEEIAIDGEPSEPELSALEVMALGL